MITSTKLIIFTSFFLAVFANFAFFNALLEIYPAEADNIPFLLSLFFVVICANLLLLEIFGIARLLKPVLILLLLIAASSAYFMDSYNIIIDQGMLENMLATDAREVRDLLSFKLLAYLFFIGFLPSIIVYKLKITPSGFKKALVSRLLLLIATICLLLVNGLVFSKQYTSFIRNYRMVRTYITPAYPIYSSIKLLGRNIGNGPQQLQALGTDASTPANSSHREIIVLVVGEAARADHFSLNGYQRKTNPRLEHENVVSFNNVWSCGTSTAASLPCMFSYLEKNNYTKTKAKHLENSLDVLRHAGVNVYWLDNNSSSKGVAIRVEETDFREPEINPICDIECRDVGMLTRVQEIIDSKPSGDILIVLHQMGSHGPAYYKRYPAEFEKFKPVCRTNQLEQCSQTEITNAYDNTILYTDYFLSELIIQLKKNESSETGMFYISDHGESLGKNGLYLHGLPYLLAPDEQKNVAMLMWFNLSILANDINLEKLLSSKDTCYSHDNIFHTLLGLFEIQSEVYEADKDILEHTI